MIHINFLSSALKGLPLRMTVTQGRSSRNLSIDAFGVDTVPAPGTETGTSTEIPVPPPSPPLGGTDGATLTISVRRGQQQIAPEGMAFFAEISGFDAQKPPEGKVYDPTMHDIHYEWTFGDPGTFTAPENILIQWKNKNVAYGPFPSHVFTRPGSYTVICTAHERSSGKSASATLDVTVQDPEVVFTSATTVICSSSGNFNGAPAHDLANRTTTFVDAIARLKALKARAQPCRLLFRGGDTFTSLTSTYVGSAFHNFYVSAFGTGRATITATTDGAVFAVHEGLTVSGASISRLAMVGPWDSTTETLDPAYTKSHAPHGILINGGFGTAHDCTFSGFWQGMSSGIRPTLTAIFSDCRSTNWEDYGMYVGGTGKEGDTVPLLSYVGILGCRFDQDRNALQGANGKSNTSLGNRHGALRCHAVGHIYVDVLDAFTRNGWTAVGGVPADQNIIRDHRNHSLSRGYFSRIMGEGGWSSYGNGPAQPAPPDSLNGTPNYPCNAVVDKAYFLGSARGQGQFGISSGAFTCRNIILHRPNIGTGADSFNKNLSVGVGNPTEFTPQNRLEPIRLYNITIVNEMDDVQQARNNRGSTAWEPTEIRPNCYESGVVKIENLVVHRPNHSSGTTADAPLDTTRLGLVPRYLGYRWKNHPASNLGDKLTMDTSFATPANPWALWRPASGSAAIRSASGLTAHDDLLGRVRPAQASRGAIEPA